MERGGVRMGLTRDTQASFDQMLSAQVEAKLGASNEILSWISNNLSPDDVFSEAELDQWAKENYYIKEE